VKIHLHPVAALAVASTLAAVATGGMAASKVDRFHSTPEAAPARSSQVQAGPPVRNFPGSETTAVAAGNSARDAPPAPASHAASPLTPPQSPAGQAAQPGPLNLAQVASRLAPPKGSNGGPPINIAG
jgi:hypothetical protein